MFEGKSNFRNPQIPRNSCCKQIDDVFFCEYTTRRDRVTIFFFLINRLILYRLLFKPFSLNVSQIFLHISPCRFILLLLNVMYYITWSCPNLFNQFLFDEYLDCLQSIKNIDSETVFVHIFFGAPVLYFP